MKLITAMVHLLSSTASRPTGGPKMRSAFGSLVSIHGSTIKTGN
jgi:hypothetical protein